MHRITLHVPEALNDGSPIPAGYQTWVEDELGHIAAVAQVESGVGEPGITICEHGTGLWWSPAWEKQREPMRLMAIDVADDGTSVDLVYRLAERIGADLGQNKVYMTTSPITVIVVACGGAALSREMHANPSAHQAHAKGPVPVGAQ